jgi:hypothetical protein
MTSDRQFDALLRSWLDASAPSDQPQGLLESVVTATAHTRPRPAWLVRLGGEPMPDTDRPALNRFAPLALAATAVVVALLIGISLLVGRPNVGPSPVPNKTHEATPQPTEQTAAAWTATGGMIEPRVLGYTATLLPDGKVLVAGGRSERTAGELASAELFDPGSGTWTATGAMIEARYDGYTATLLRDGKVLVAGGWAGHALASAELYDPSSGTWSATGSMGAVRFYHSATLLKDGRVLVAGGVGSGGGLASAELYDPRTGSWTATGTMIGADDQIALLLLDGKVLVLGAASAEVYDPSSGTWTATGKISENRGGYTATLLPDGKVLVAGGDSATLVVQPDVGGPGPDALTLASAELYDPRTGSWTVTGSMTEARRGHTATPLPNGAVLVAGGYRNSAEGTMTLASAELYDPSSGTWTATAGMLAARIGHTATLLADGRVLVAGGADPAPAEAPAELYDPGGGTR